VAARASDGVAHRRDPIHKRKSFAGSAAHYAAYDGKARKVMRAMRTELGTEGADIDTDPLLPLRDAVLDFEESAAQGAINR
jgi:hypothetical protein